MRCRLAESRKEAEQLRGTVESLKNELRLNAVALKVALLAMHCVQPMRRQGYQDEHQALELEFLKTADDHKKLKFEHEKLVCCDSRGRSQ